MYSTVRAVITHNGEISECIYSNLGVRQWDSSSALLFTLNELKPFLILKADDLVLFAASPESLKLMLNDIENYCKMEIKN